MGICMALGADRFGLIRDIVRRTAAPGALGLVVGLALAGSVGSSFRGFLFEVEPWDPVSFLGAALFLAGVMLVAAFVPARSATATSPAEVLRQE
jgi:ABC-type antimicrobial peptide transport system permease subunit